MLAFVKILKKFDKVSKVFGFAMLLFRYSILFYFISLKMIIFLYVFFQVTGKQVLPIYLKVVESSYFNSSNKVNFDQDTIVFIFLFFYLHA